MYHNYLLFCQVSIVNDHDDHDYDYNINIWPTLSFQWAEISHTPAEKKYNSLKHWLAFWLILILTRVSMKSFFVP